MPIFLSAGGHQQASDGAYPPPAHPCTGRCLAPDLVSPHGLAGTGYVCSLEMGDLLQTHAVIININELLIH